MPRETDKNLRGWADWWEVRPPTGWVIGDVIQPVVVVADVQNLVSPERAALLGVGVLVAGAVGDFSMVELQAGARAVDVLFCTSNVAGTKLNVGTTTRLSSLTSLQPPAFSQAPVGSTLTSICRVGRMLGADGALPPWTIAPTISGAPTTMPRFTLLPGEVLSISGPGTNTLIQVQLLWLEWP